MSGHSKFSNIRAKKEKNDAAKGKIFTIIGHELALAVKQGGTDPNSNSKLRDVIAKAKANNMPNDTIQNGIKKAAGALDAVNFEEMQYEGYGVNGVAIIVKVLTDNKNRSAADVRSAFTKGKGSLGAQGSVSFLFEEKGQIILDKEVMDDLDKDFDALMDIAIMAGAEDLIDRDDSYEIITSPADFSTVRENLEQENIPMVQAEVVMIPGNTVSVTEEEAVKNLRKTLDLLDASDDVQSVYTNWEEESKVPEALRALPELFLAKQGWNSFGGKSQSRELHPLPFLNFFFPYNPLPPWHFLFPRRSRLQARLLLQRDGREALPDSFPPFWQ